MARDFAEHQVMEKDIQLLSRTAANHLFLGQFELFRASIASLFKRSPQLALSILQTIIAQGGRLEGILWSHSCPSPSHLLWFSTLELLSIGQFSSYTWSIDVDALRLKAEFILLLQLVSSAVPHSASVLDRILNFATSILWIDVTEDAMCCQVDSVSELTEQVVQQLRGLILVQPAFFVAICHNIQKQLQWLDHYDWSMAITTEPEHSISRIITEELNILQLIQKQVQITHLDALRECFDSSDDHGFISHLRYLQPDHGIAESECRVVLENSIKRTWSKRWDFGNIRDCELEKLLMMYIEVLSSGSFEIAQLIQVSEDKLLLQEIERNRNSGNVVVPFPLRRLHEYLEASILPASEENSRFHHDLAVKQCRGDMYHYSRVLGSHTIECILNAALSAAESEKFQEASNFLRPFPLLQPLVAVMGWDLLRGKTAARRKLMHSLWISKSQVLRLEESSRYGKQSNEVSCVEYLCDLLCYRLDAASFVGCTNSGVPWNIKSSLLLYGKDCKIEENASHSESFVENFVLERLSIETPFRVLFDVVPGIKFQDALELLSMQPICSTEAALKRIQDIELAHMRYALETVVHAISNIECVTGKETRSHGHQSMALLKVFQNHLEAIQDVSRKIMLVAIVISLLHMGDVSICYGPCGAYVFEQPDIMSAYEEENDLVLAFVHLILSILRRALPYELHELENTTSLESVRRKILEWQMLKVSHFLEDWEWRLSILKSLLPIPEGSWGWKETLTILRAAPSTLLDFCMQKAKYEIGEEAVHRFSLSQEDKASLEVAEWMDRNFKRASVEDSMSRIAENLPDSVQELDFSALKAQLGFLHVILLCIDAATTAARSIDTCKKLLDQAEAILSEIYPGAPPKLGSFYWDQIQETSVISMSKHILKSLRSFLEEDQPVLLQTLFSGITKYPPVEQLEEWHRQEALFILHQMIEDAHGGKRQFLSGKLHNLARAIVDEEMVDISVRSKGFPSDGKGPPSAVQGVAVGLGLRSGNLGSSNALRRSIEELIGRDTGGAQKSSFGVGNKASTYLSSFILYIASIGDIVDGVDSTHDFNFFSIVYDWPKDLLTRLVFEQGSTDAAVKVAEIMHVDFVHEVISACVPPLYPPVSHRSWASLPIQTVLCKEKSAEESLLQPSRGGKRMVFTSSLSSSKAKPPPFPLQLELVRHLAKLSPVRAVLASAFESSILSGSKESCTVKSHEDSEGCTPDYDRLFYEFALDQSERFPTLNRWIQMQSNLHRVSESAPGSDAGRVLLTIYDTNANVKRSRESDYDSESEVDEDNIRSFVSPPMTDITSGPVSAGRLGSSPLSMAEPTTVLSFECESEEPYKKAVERLICEKKLNDALALSDRCLKDGASDELLQLLIEQHETDSSVAQQGSCFGSHGLFTESWRLVLRLRDKRLAAKLASRYLHRWDLDAALDVLTMCSCHLPGTDPIKLEVLQQRESLLRYRKILLADGEFNNWQEIELEYKADPEGLALRLSAKGAVSTALDVSENAGLSIELRRELQGRHLVKLLTTDPLDGGGPAAASRFLSSLRASDDALPVAMSAMHLLSDLRSKQLLVHFLLKRRPGNLSQVETSRFNKWALGLRVLNLLPLPWQQRCSALHEHPHLILEVLMMRKQIQSASLILMNFPSLRDDNVVFEYAAKAITVTAASSVRSVPVSAPKVNQKGRIGTPRRSNISSTLSSLQKEARRAFSWGPRNPGTKLPAKELQRKRKSTIVQFNEGVVLEGRSGIDSHISVFMAKDEKLPTAAIAEEWVLTGDPDKDKIVRISHRYESSPDISLFKALVSLCSSEIISAKGALDLCVTQMKNALSSEHLPLHASMETVGRAYLAAETYVQCLLFIKSQLRGVEGGDSLPKREVADSAFYETEGSNFNNSSHSSNELSDLLLQAEIWLARAELLQSLLGSGVIVSLDDIANNESSAHLRDRLIADERYSMAVYTCKKCKIDAFPVWAAWGHALLRMERYAQARVKFKQALQLYKGDTSPVIAEIIGIIDSGCLVDFDAVNSMYEHLARSAPTILDDSLSADAYLNVLHMPSTFPRAEKPGHSEEMVDPLLDLTSDFHDGPSSNLDSIKYAECVSYLQEFQRHQMLAFMFRHGRYHDACLLFFPPNSVPPPIQPSPYGSSSSCLSPQRPDLLATDYGTIDDLCDLCIGYGAIPVLEKVVSGRLQSSACGDAVVHQHTVAALSRICSYFETHKHFNFLYKFEVIINDPVAAGLCCIQLFVNSFSQEEAIKHLDHAKIHFEEALTMKHKAADVAKSLSRSVRAKSASEKLSEESLVKFSARVAIQADVLKVFNDIEGPQWKHSLFGNPNDLDTFRRRCLIAESLIEKNFDLAFQVIYEFGLPAVDIYARVSASLAERKKGGQLTEFLRNIKGTIDTDDWDQVLGAAINIYANKHRERPDRLIDMLTSNHRKVLACVICGRLKSAFQIASRSGSIADVQYVAHQALCANALPVLDMCKHWLAQHT